MDFIKLDINKHDLLKVSELIYETDTETLNFYFKNKKNAGERIETLIKAGDNSWGYENIYIVTTDSDQVLGVLLAYKADEDPADNDFKAYFKNLNIIDALKFTILNIVDEVMTGYKLDKDDYYLSDIAVDKEYRLRGVGTFILENALELARGKKCKRVVLDVYINNTGALNFYEKFGFNIFNTKHINWFGREKGINSMEYKL